VGAAFVAGLSGFSQTITIDIGGTSTDVALINGTIVETTSGQIGGYPSRLPMIDIHTVGAGGGSLAWFDSGGALRVGPASAGAAPGPAAYARGGSAATVTDANVVLGRLLPDAFLGGRMQLDVEAARRAMAPIAQELGLRQEEAALGIIHVVNANMEAAIRGISVERGIDPRYFTLVAFGGAGPLHACELAEALRIPRVLVPSVPGVLSALGMLVADTLKDYVRTVMLATHEAQEKVPAVLAELEAQGKADLNREGIVEEHIVLERYLDLRYAGQSYELVIPFTKTIEQAVRDFHSAHQQRFGYSDVNEQVQIVNVRLKARGLAEALHFEAHPLVSDAQSQPASTRKVVFAEVHGQARHLDAGVYARDKLIPGSKLAGPAIVTQYDTTTVLPPSWLAHVDAYGQLVLERTQEEAQHV
jgi:N-methylhydantoinase A